MKSSDLVLELSEARAAWLQAEARAVADPTRIGGAEFWGRKYDALRALQAALKAREALEAVVADATARIAAAEAIHASAAWDAERAAAAVRWP